MRVRTRRSARRKDRSRRPAAESVGKDLAEQGGPRHNAHLPGCYHLPLTASPAACAVTPYLKFFDLFAAREGTVPLIARITMENEHQGTAWYARPTSAPQASGTRNAASQTCNVR